MPENQTLNVAIGQRIEATTYRETVALDRDSILQNPELLDKVLESGIYSILAGMKNAAAQEIQSPMQFRAWAQSVTVEHIEAYVNRESKRGRTVEYSQADRIRDAKVLMKAQVALINFGKLLPLTTWAPMDEAVRNMNESKMRSAPPDMAQWFALFKEYKACEDKAHSWAKEFPTTEVFALMNWICSLSGIDLMAELKTN